MKHMHAVDHIYYMASDIKPYMAPEAIRKGLFSQSSLTYILEFLSIFIPVAYV